MKRLMIIKSPGNNEGSAQYARKIKRLAKEDGNVEAKPYEVHTQLELKELLDKTEDKFVLLNPTTLEFPFDHHDRNADKGCVVDAVTTYMLPESKNTDKILLLGYGTIGEPVFHQLKSLKYNVFPIQSNAEFSPEFINEFDLIINCTDGREVGYYYSGVVLDVAGNWKTKTHVSTDLTGDIPVKVIREPQPQIISCANVGTVTVKLLLAGI